MAAGEHNRGYPSLELPGPAADCTDITCIAGDVAKARLWLVDLAGSERLSRSEAVGERLAEAQVQNPKPVWGVCRRGRAAARVSSALLVAVPCSRYGSPSSCSTCKTALVGAQAKCG